MAVVSGFATQSLTPLITSVTCPSTLRLVCGSASSLVRLVTSTNLFLLFVEFLITVARRSSTVTALRTVKLPEESTAQIITPTVQNLTHEEFQQIEENSAADRYVRSRNLNPARFYYASSGRYAGRLIIPFEDEHGLFYFTARALGEPNSKVSQPSQVRQVSSPPMSSFPTMRTAQNLSSSQKVHLTLSPSRNADSMLLAPMVAPLPSFNYDICVTIEVQSSLPTTMTARVERD